MAAFDYIRDPAAIYEQSFRTIEAEADLSRFETSERDVAIRVIHACGMVEAACELAFSAGAAAAGQAALGAGAAIFCDVEMVRHGIIADRLPANNAIVCTLNQPGCADYANGIATTRSAAAVDFWDERLGGSVVAIGNAPTSLFRLLERILDGAPKPALVVGVPVGFVGAVESKQALSTFGHGIPFITLHGRRGGSAIACAIVNALSAGVRA